MLKGRMYSIGTGGFHTSRHLLVSSQIKAPSKTKELAFVFGDIIDRKAGGIAMATVSEAQAFLFLSRILGKNITDSSGLSVGKIVDLAANLAEPYPPVTGVLCKTQAGKTPTLISWRRITALKDGLLPTCSRPSTTGASWAITSTAGL